MSIQTSDADLKAAQFPPPILNGWFIPSSAAAGTMSGVVWTNLFLLSDGNGFTVLPYAFNIKDSAAFLLSGGSAKGTNDMTLAVDYTGHITTLSYEDSPFRESSGLYFSIFDATMTGGKVDSVIIDLEMGNSVSGQGSSAYLTTDQSSPLDINTLIYDTTGAYPLGFAVDIEASNVTTLTSPASMDLTGSNTTFSGAFDQASVDGILASAVAGNSGLGTMGGGTLTIGGTSASPSSTGAGYVATLRGNGMTVTTN